MIGRSTSSTTRTTSLEFQGNTWTLVFLSTSELLSGRIHDPRCTMTPLAIRGTVFVEFSFAKCNGNHFNVYTTTQAAEEWHNCGIPFPRRHAQLQAAAPLAPACPTPSGLSSCPPGGSSLTMRTCSF